MKRRTGSATDSSRSVVEAGAVRIARRPCLLLLVAVAGMTGCPAHADRSGGDPGARRFYLTKAMFQGNKVLDACARGYHTASRFEILDVSLLRYDSELGVTSDDSGTGPPGHASAYGAEDPTGWIRTGGSSRFTDTGGAGSALTNCSAWTTTSPDAYGTVAYLGDRFTSDGASPAPLWNGGPERCSVAHHVWCIEDFPAAAGAAEPERPHGPHGRRHDEE